MDAGRLFDENLALIERVIARVSNRAGLIGADREDFASDVCVALLSDDGRILRDWEQRASLATYLIVIVQRLLADARRQTSGKWKPSAEARRLGDAAVTLEHLLRRQGRSVDEALPAVQAIDPSITREEASAIADRLPQRAPRPRIVPLDPELDLPSARDLADGGAVATEARRLMERTSEIVRRRLEAMPIEDQMIVRLRFASGMTIADISRILRLPQRPLYRRIEAIVTQLRRVLRNAAIDPGAIEELIGSPHGEMDFEFWKNATAVPAQGEGTEGQPDAAEQSHD